MSARQERAARPARLSARPHRLRNVNGSTIPPDYALAALVVVLAAAIILDPPAALIDGRHVLAVIAATVLTLRSIRNP